ncbi:MAG: ATP-binding protein [Clostridia bacterium]|nr:ATP-binding protein [Clostridia bacterium]
MVNIICGPKGSGKTKQIIDQANAAAEKAKGNVIFITKSKTYSVNINFDVKCVYTDEYGIDSIDSFRGFINGAAAANYDLEYVFIDGIARITKADLSELESIFISASKLNDINFTFTISSTKEELPDYLRKFCL